ncbi:hypothetical protein [Azospira restricta]|uniref:EfeO-type cupredoxin-like domain-containing protein n=1 Tax=Azospira restricta TaxID=404405 RepID=A0A974SM94_9RHOO|nr:hypothetical protein [Azospira restricta]QRJ62440.1 hypothetical protein IWH25_11655 [Azospira restricta]
MRKTPFLLALAIVLAPLPPASAADAAEAKPPLSEETRVAVLKAADWKEMQSVNLELRDYGLSPRELRFKAGQPYRLVITNNGSHSHYFNAPEFLQNIAARKAQVKDQVEVKAPFFSAFELARRGGNVELFFIPVNKGSYRMYCHLEGKAHEGVQGAVIIE